MSNSQIITDQETAEEIIRSICIDAQKVTFINHGYHNLIAAIDEQYVFRFPRSTQTLGRFDFELEVLQALDGKLTIQTPHVLKKSSQPAYAMLHYIPGQELQNKQLRSLSNEDQQAIGEQLAQFVQELNQAISINQMESLHAQTNAQKTLEPWTAYLHRIFAPQQENRALQAIIDSHYGAWQAVTAKDRPQIVVHDDIHSGNLLFENDRLSGVLDFEHATVGTIEQEFRYLYRQGGHVLSYAIAAYERTIGQTIDNNDIRIWAITTELAAFVRRLNSGDTSHDSFKRTRAKLRHWIKDFPL
jgi:aminoglycoside phosphotransferase (APT) family kinase protein